MKGNLIAIFLILLSLTSCNNRVIADFEITNSTGIKIDSLKIEPMVVSEGKFISLEPNEKAEYKADMTGIAKIDGSGISFEYEYDQTQSFHARSIETNTGWKISIDRGLDIFQPYDFKNPFNLANNIQEERLCKGFEVTYLKDLKA